MLTDWHKAPRTQDYLTATNSAFGFALNDLRIEPAPLWCGVSTALSKTDGVWFLGENKLMSKALTLIYLVRRVRPSGALRVNDTLHFTTGQE